MAVIVEVVREEMLGGSAQGPVKVVEVVRTASTPRETVSASATVEVIREGGTVANAQWGTEFPVNPYEGQIFVKVTQ